MTRSIFQIDEKESFVTIKTQGQNPWDSNHVDENGFVVDSMRK
jgi:hypothetical protein